MAMDANHSGANSITGNSGGTDNKYPDGEAMKDAWELTLSEYADIGNRLLRRRDSSPSSVESSWTDPWEREKQRKLQAAGNVEDDGYSLSSCWPPAWQVEEMAKQFEHRDAIKSTEVTVEQNEMSVNAKPSDETAEHLGVHADVVERVIGPLGPEPKARPERPRLLDPYVGFIDEVLERYPKLVSTRIYDMIVERGYAGSLRTLTRHVAEVRPAPKSEVFLRTERLPGEQSQIDWGHVGKLRVPGGERALWVFVIVLAFSRAIWAELVFDLTVHSVRRSLARAAAHFGGATRQWLFDNPKTIVLERQGDLI
ncbi:MAG: DDE-type integrase/transposase/recombinase, partial [bacterium]|nr:DDE-type integrase/transposase/recombinase [bacterium]